MFDLNENKISLGAEMLVLLKNKKRNLSYDLFQYDGMKSKQGEACHFVWERETYLTERRSG